MNGIDVVKAALATTKTYFPWYLEGFSDAELLVRPVPEANHTAWQLGNIIAGDVFLTRQAAPDAVFPELPADFEHRHGKDNAHCDDPASFHSKEEYIQWFAAVRDATIAAVARMSDADLDHETPAAVRGYAPTVGHLFLAISDHTLMHLGQLTVIRRKLGKPVLF